MTTITDIYSAAEVLKLMGIPVGSKINVRLKCPKCGKENFYMRVDGQKNVGKCWSCSFFCNHTQFYAEVYNMSVKEANREIKERLNIQSCKDKQVVRNPIAASVSNNSVPMQPTENRDAVYRSMIHYLKFSGKHVKDMEKRGLILEEISKLLYASYYSEDSKDMTRALLAKGYQLEGIPGFYLDEQTHEWEARSLKKGILVPYLDIHNQIQGFQLRKDNEVLKMKKNGKLEKKCNWFSSPDFNKGCGCKTFYHMACDFYFDFSSNEYSPILDDTLYLTEGAMKGDIIHLIEKIPVICVPGVEALTELRILFESNFLQSKGVKKIVDLYDMDYITNPNVQNAMEKLKKMVSDADFTYERKTWEIHVEGHKDLKGYDDYLAYHKRNI